MLTLVLVVFALANLGLELGANLFHQLGEARDPSSGRDTSHGSMRIHGHFRDKWLKPLTVDSQMPKKRLSRIDD